MADIIFSTAWQCGDKDCKQQWHQSNYWCDPDSDAGFTVDTYADGDHEDIGEADLPSDKEIAAGWLEYSRHVAATGEDPLGEFFVKRTATRTERWSFKFGPSIIGPILLAARYGRRTWTSADWRTLPAHVSEYLNLRKTGPAHLQDFATWAELEEAVGPVKNGRWWKCTNPITYPAPRPPGAYERELKAAARRHIRSATKAAA